MNHDPHFSTAVLKAAYEQTPNGVLVVDTDGAVIATNQRLAHLFGLEEPPAIGLQEPASEGILIGQVADPNPLIAMLRRIAADPDIRLEQEVSLRNGATLELHSTPITAPTGGSYGRLWLFRDVSAQRRSERRLQEEQAKFHSVVDQEIAGIAIISEDGGLIYVNKAFARFFGRSPTELTGQPLLAFVPAEERDEVTGLLADQLAGRRPVVRLASSITAPDGNSVDILMHASAAQYLGRPASIAVVLDITELQRARQELEFANIIIEQSPVVLFQSRAAPGFPLSYISRNITQFGYSVEQARDGWFRFPDYVLPADRAAVLDAVDALVTGRADLFEQDYRAVLGDGSVRWIHDRTVPIRDDTGVTVAFQGTLIDITERKQAEQALAHANRTLRTLSSGNEVVVRATSERQLLDEMCRVLVEVGGYPQCWIGFAGASADAPPRLVASCGPGDPGLRDADWSAMALPDGPAARAFNSNRPAIVRAIGPAPDRSPHNVAARQPGWSATAALPFRIGPSDRGVLALCAETADAFDPDEVRLLSELAGDLGYGLQALRTHAASEANAERLRRIMQATIQALINTLEQRDPYTAGHQRRVAALSAEIARRMGLSEEDIEGISLAASVHDVGKVAVPAEILTKPGKLSTLEYQLVQTHAQAGYDILSGIDFPWPVADIVLQHHERMDGSGYPQGLRGEEILIGGRIVAVADVVETMMTHRPYRAALGQEVALREIESGRGRLYDPVVVDTCVAVFREHGFVLPSVHG